MNATPEIKRGQYLIVRVDGSEEMVKSKPSMKEIHKKIGASCCDSVTLRFQDVHQDAIVMLVDDDGYDTEAIEHKDGTIELKCIRTRKPVNEKATALYHTRCKPGTVHQIVGDVAIVNDMDFA